MIRGRNRIIVPGIVSAVAGLLAACTQLPVDGPSYRDIHTGATTTLSNGRDPLLVYTSRNAVDFDYALIDINPFVISVLDDISPDSFYGTFGQQRGPVPVVRVGVGDVVQTSIFESSAGGLFVTGDAAGRAGNYVTLPAQTVSGKGTISIPYAGQIKAAGRTTYEIQREIESKLASRAIEPQVIVNVTEQNADSVIVIGDAGQGRIKLTGAGERILDMISKTTSTGATGKLAPYDLEITLQRKNRIGTVRLSNIINNPRENIYVEAGDVIYVYRRPRSFVAFGALGNATGGTTIGGGDVIGLDGIFQFGQERLSLNEAVAKAGGLVDERANPSQTFIYRGERRRTLELMNVNLSKFAPGQQWIPTVYRLNFRDPSAFFMAQKFQMRDKDILYVANADSIEVGKALNYMTLWTSSAAGYVGNAATVLTSAQILGGAGGSTAVIVGGTGGP
ncbi:polysaccharide biosynthesis/export family protein [Hyphomicrobium sp.]|uniref:polysaccharide biosynthesis/export family protein n=1 Tax=Hyphomicrobium sp. TaxID=82 RepID=UPI002D7A001C|nr:polysaccharide biosynthesis/export family protein [Hyphomicrobium sp.]HET6389438.1 polysaccharide biosynthesis/export family protein [Hyphomicrobium sp.]